MGNGQIYELIGKAIGKIGAIGKDKTSKDRAGVEQFKYRGIDQVYNALNPVMAELGIFFCPEVLDQKREERTTRNGAMLTYTILTIRFTAYAPDGSSVSMTVVGEGMDSGDKSSNKAMSVAMKYAMFQLFCIPTEEMKDPDADVYTDVMPKNAQRPAQRAPQAGNVSTVDKLPAPKADAPKQAEKPAETKPETPGSFLMRSIAEMTAAYREYGFNFAEARQALIDGGIVQDIPSATMTMEQAQELIRHVAGIYEDRKAKAAS
jgi:hypothetical protein